MILTLHGKPILKAVATSAGLGVPITIAATIGYMLAGLPQQAALPPFSIGFVSLLGVVLMAPVSSLIAPYGARLAHALQKRRLEVVRMLGVDPNDAESVQILIGHHDRLRRLHDLHGKQSDRVYARHPRRQAGRHRIVDAPPIE